MKLRLNYVPPSDGKWIDAGEAHSDPWWDIWLDNMIKANPDTIFFYTTVTTDIWEDDEPKCICMDSPTGACGRGWCDPSCEVCYKPEDHSCSCHTAWPQRGACSICVAIGCEHFDKEAIFFYMNDGVWSPGVLEEDARVYAQDEKMIFFFAKPSEVL